MNQNINDSKSHIRNSFSEKFISGIQRFYVCPEVPVDIIRVFFLILDFLAESFKADKKPILRNSPYLALQIICFHNTAKKISEFINFPANMFLMSEKIFALHHLLTPKNCTLEALCQKMYLYFYISP